MNEETKTAVVPEDAVVAQAEEEVAQKSKSIISYDDFVKLDITIGTIVSVEVVEGADKLLKLEVDIQEEKPRQIISGIREYFEDIQFLVGKQCPFLTNLEPRTIRGFESQGMILASEHDGVFSLLIPHNALPAGTRVS
jgi:methionine--tRNA ligase beta chain